MAKLVSGNMSYVGCLYSTLLLTRCTISRIILLSRYGQFFLLYIKLPNYLLIKMAQWCLQILDRFGTDVAKEFFFGMYLTGGDD